MVQNGGFYAAEAEVIRCILHMGTREVDSMRISLFCQLIDLWPARIAESDGTGYLIEGFSCRVVSRSSKDFKGAIVFYNHKMGMASGDDFTQERRLQIRVFDIVRRDVAFNMVNADQRFLFRIGDRFCLCHADEKCADKARAVRNTDRIDIIQSDIGFF